MDNQEQSTPLRKWIVLFRNGAGVNCEAVDPAAAIRLAKAEQQALGRTKKELKIERVVERKWEDDGGGTWPPALSGR